MQTLELVVPGNTEQNIKNVKPSPNPVNLMVGEQTTLDTKMISLNGNQSEECVNRLQIPNKSIGNEEQVEIRPKQQVCEKPVGKYVGDFGIELGSKQDTGDADAGSNGRAIDPAEIQPQQKCFNKFCNANAPLKTIRSRVQDNQISLCRQCYSSYCSNMFCGYCEQVYFRNQLPDNFQWIKCNECDRKTHLHCVKIAHRIHTNYSRYVCSNCEKKRKRKRNLQEPDLNDQKLSTRRPISAQRTLFSLQERCRIFIERKQVLNLLDCFLMSCSYKIALPDDEISRDLFTLHRNTSSANSDKGDSDVLLPKKKKKL